VILVDITEITQARGALVAQQRFLQSVIDGISDPIVVIGTNYRVLLMISAPVTRPWPPLIGWRSASSRSTTRSSPGSLRTWAAVSSPAP